jgi:hypothetical protein
MKCVKNKTNPQYCTLLESVTHVFGVSRDVIGGLAVVCALCQPSLDGVAVRWCMVFATTLETEKMRSQLLHRSYQILCFQNDGPRDNED